MGAIAGGMIAFFLLGKIVEWILLKRVIKNYPLMVWLSSILVFSVIALAWYAKRNEAYAFNLAMFIDYFLAALFLPVVRIVWRKRKQAKAREVAN